jgi:choice-of-anchor A domain-containing protein
VTQTSRPNRLLVTAACIGATMAIALVTLYWEGPAAAAPDWPPNFGPCSGGPCPPDWPPSGNTDSGYRDNTINVFVGGNMSVVEGAAEAEGRVVVMKDFDQNKSGGGMAYNIGIVGEGSQVRPPVNSVAFAVGGNITVATGQRTLLDGAASHALEAQYAGSLTGTVIANPVTQTANAVAAYSSVPAQLQAISDCINTKAQSEATGTAVNTGSETVFTGNGTSAIQIFDVNFDLATASGGMQGLRFAGIPTGATVIINVRGATRNVRTYTGGDGGPLDTLARRVLWNFPDSTTVNLIGATQFQGSVLVANPASTTRMAYSGANGRFYTNGNLIHGGGGLRGQEFHSYPFMGTLPSCTANTTTTTTTTTSTSSTTSSSTTTTVPGSTTTTTGPATTTTAPAHMTTTTRPRGASAGGGLPRTGAPLTVLAFAGFTALAAGLLARRAEHWQQRR